MDRGGRKEENTILKVIDDNWEEFNKIDFEVKRGHMAVYLTDGRIVIVPISMFPDIKRLERRSLNAQKHFFRSVLLQTIVA